MKPKIKTNIYIFVVVLLVIQVVLLITPDSISSIFDLLSKVKLLQNIKAFYLVLSTVFIVFALYLIWSFISVTTRVFRSKRLDVVVSFLGAIGIASYFRTPTFLQWIYSYKEYFVINKENILIYTPPLVVISLSLAFLVFLSIFWAKWKKILLVFIEDFYKEDSGSKKTEDLPMNVLDTLEDDPWTASKNDMLGYLPLAKKFSKKVLEGETETSLVFGIEAPWGSGKTSFLTMCKESWKLDSNEPLVIDFNPWHFDTDTDLIKKYFQHLKVAIQQKYFYPEIDRSISKYLNLVSSVGIGGWLNIKALPQSEDIKKVHDEIGTLLRQINIKIVVIVDDLDRISLDKSKQILKLVALCADFPNMRYLLCYDLENLYSSDTYTVVDRTRGAVGIGRENISVPVQSLVENVDLRTAHQVDNAPLQSYIEKIINVKYILPYYQKDMIISYLVNSVYAAFFEFNKSEKNLPQIVPISKQQLGEDISKFFDEYPNISRKFIFSLRQVKSIVKTFLSAQENNPRFFVYDLSKVDDLILLIVLKYHFPKVYSDICYYEYGKTPWFFGNPKYRFTSAHNFSNDRQPLLGYKTYITDHLLDSTVSEILTLIFDKKGSHMSSREDYLDNYHLNQYIKFIEGIDDGRLTDSIFIEFFKNFGNQEGQDTVSKFKNYVKNIIFDVDGDALENKIKNSFLLQEFFNKIAGKIYEINRIDDNICIQLIDEVISSAPRYSLLGFASLSDTRDHFYYLIAKILNEGVWNKKGKGNNTIENTKVIAGYLLKHGEEKTILEKIAVGKGPIGMYEMVALKFSFNSSRSGNLWDIGRALMWHKLSDNGSNSVSDSAVNQTNDLVSMEEVSQNAFAIFKTEYIDNKKNFLKEIDDIKPEDVLGSDVSSDSVWLDTIKRDEKFEVGIGIIKAKIEMFTIYDFCFDGDHGGMRCGGYEYQGQKIRNIMQDYLFQTCFVNSVDPNIGYECFMNLLLRSFESLRVFDDDRKYAFYFDKIVNILNKERLLEYWKNNRDKIKELYSNKEGIFFGGHYNVYFKTVQESKSDLTNDDGTGVFDVLDKELSQSESSVVNPVLLSEVVEPEIM